MDRDILEAHHAKVREVVPQHQLLEMELNEGWEPLCKFLGLPIPQEPFPKANDAKAADDYATKVILQALGVWILLLSGIGAGFYLVVRTWVGLL